MQSNFVKKEGIIIRHLARHLFLMEENQKIPTVAEIIEKLDTSSGMVQKAISFLESNNCVVLEKNGKKGTILIEKNPSKLLEFANWQHITGSIPLPLTDSMATLASSVSSVLESMPIPFVFAYMTGANNRLSYLLNGGFDFIIISKATALEYCKENSNLEIAVELTDSIYSYPYAIITHDKNQTEIRENMRVGIDYTCFDHAVYTKKACEGINVNFIEIPYTDMRKALISDWIDCTVFRTDNLTPILGQIPLPFEVEDNITPVLLTRKDSYGMKQLLIKYLPPYNVMKLQRKKQNGTFIANFY